MKVVVKDPSLTYLNESHTFAYAASASVSYVLTEIQWATIIVKDYANAAVQGATVSIHGTSLTGTTDANGEVKIILNTVVSVTGNAANFVIDVSATGFET